MPRTVRAGGSFTQRGRPCRGRPTDPPSGHRRSAGFSGGNLRSLELPHSRRQIVVRVTASDGVDELHLDAARAV